MDRTSAVGYLVVVFITFSSFAVLAAADGLDVTLAVMYPFAATAGVALCVAMGMAASAAKRKIWEKDGK